MTDFSSYFTKIFKPSKYLAVSVNFIDNDPTLSVLEIREKKDTSFEVIKSVTNINYSDFFRDFDAKHPVLLNVEGDLVISKQYDKGKELTEALILRDSIDNYYFFEQEIGEHNFISYCDNGVIDDIIKVFSKEDFFITRITLGPFVVSYISSFITPNETIVTNNYSLRLQDARLLEFSAGSLKKGLYKLQEQEFTSDTITPLAAYFCEKIEAPEEHKKLQENRQELKYKNVLLIVGPVFLGIIICSLFMGHFMKKQKAESLASKQSEISFIELNKNKLVNLEKDRDYKEEVLFSSGFNIAHPFSVQVTEMVNTLPDEIILTKVAVQPLSRKVKENEKITLYSKRIEVMGRSTNDNIIDVWVKKLNEVEWIKKISNISFEENKINQKIFNLTIDTE